MNVYKPNMIWLLESHGRRPANRALKKPQKKKRVLNLRVEIACRNHLWSMSHMVARPTGREPICTDRITTRPLR